MPVSVWRRLSLVLAALYLLSAVPSRPAQAGPSPVEWVVAFGWDTSEPAARAELARSGFALVRWLEDTHLALARTSTSPSAPRAPALASSPRVEYVTEHRRSVFVADVPLDERWAEQWGPQRASAPAAWDLAWGDPSTVVAFVDTGAHYDHADLASQVWINPGESEVDEFTGRLVCGRGRAVNGIDDDSNGYVDDCRGYDFAYRDPDPLDQHGHGTAVAGILAAAVNNPDPYEPGGFEGMAGMARRSRLMVLQAMDNGGAGAPFNIAEAIAYAVANGARVVNLSLTLGAKYQPEDAEILCRAVAAAQSANVLVVGASGNHSAGGPAPVSYPAACPGAVAVGASTRTDTRALFSDYGPRLDIIAPGEGILSTLRAGKLYGYYQSTGSGTSFAAPHVSGVAAIIRALRPDLPESGVYDLLRETADDVGAPGFDVETGMGRLNAEQAVLAALAGLELRMVPESSEARVGNSIDLLVSVLSMDRAVAGAGARVHLSSSLGTVSTVIVTLDAAGTARVPFEAGWQPGNAGITASLGPLSAAATVRVTPPHSLYLPLLATG